MKSLLIAVLALFLAACDPEEKYPAQVGLVNDFAEVLTPEEETKIIAMLEGVKAGAVLEEGEEEPQSFVLVVVTVPDLKGDTVEDYTIGLANKWGVGQKDKDNGVVFLVAPKDRKLRIENGYGAEATLTDIESKRIIDNIVIPRLKADKVAEGVLAGTEALVAKLGGGEIPVGLEMEPVNESIPLWLLILGALVVIILLSTPGGRDILFVIAASRGSGSGGGSSGGRSSGSGGGSFGGGGASGSY